MIFATGMRRLRGMTSTTIERVRRRVPLVGLMVVIVLFLGYALRSHT